jgi:hypothetical protein
MPGLLEALETALSGSGLSGKISAQASGLGGITSAVSSLVGGTPAVTQLQTAIRNAPAPPGLDGIGALSSSLGSLSVPSDFSGALGPVLSPLTALATQLAGGSAAQVAAVFDLVREVIRAASGRTMGGPSGMPDGGLRQQDMPSVDELRAMFVKANQLVDDLGPRFDAARILQLLERASSGYTRPDFFLPRIPGLDDIMEPLGTIAAWQTMPPDQLSAHLARTVELAAELIASPRQRVAAPLMQAAQAVGGGQAAVAAAVADLTPVCATLRSKLTTGKGQPSVTEVTALERAAELASGLAGALDPATSPLAHCDTADEDATRALLAVVRALEPAYDMAPLARTLQEKIAQIPPAPEGVFEGVAAAIQAFDLSALTDPLQSVTATVRHAVDEVNQAKESVRQALESALSPVAAALDDALSAAGFDQIRETLNGLPAQVQQFVDNEITPKLEGVRTSVSSAVGAVSSAADEFNPEALIAPIRDAVQQAASLLQSDEVRNTFAELEQALNSAIQAIEHIDLSGAADQCVTEIGGIETKVSSIDLSSVPDMAKPALREAVKVVTDIDFTAEVGRPVITKLEQAVEQGPAAVLNALEDGMDQLRSRIEGFRPSKVVGDALDKPFRELLDTLKKFKPSDLLGLLQHELDQLAGRLRVLDVGAVVDPLIELHTSIKTKVEALRPSHLLKPVDDAIAAAIEKVYQATGIDTVFHGIDEVLHTIQSWIGLLADARDLLHRTAALFEAPGDATATVSQMVDAALTKLDTVDISRLHSAFTAASTAAASIERDAMARDLAMAFQTAGQRGPALLASAELDALARLARGFLLEELRAQRETPSRNRLIAAVEALRAAADRLAAARQPWVQLAPKLNEAAGAIQERLLDYYRVSQLEGATLFADFRNPPQTAAALKDAVRDALNDALKEPLTTVVMGFQAIAPFVRLLAEGVSSVLGALHAKFDSLVGNSGVGGAVDAIEEAANLLRGINLQPVVQPLDAIYARIETALNSLDPAPLRAALEAARDAVASLLRVTTLINQSDIDTLDRTYAEAVAKIGALSPSAVISQTLDPVYEQLLGEVLPILDMPKRLRQAVDDAGKSLRDEATRELARVEEAFDKMLQAIPLGGGGGSLSATASASAG